MATPNPSYTVQNVVSQLSTLKNQLDAELVKLEEALAADTTDPIDPYSHHAYKMMDHGAFDAIRKILDGGILDKTNARIADANSLNAIILKYSVATYSVTLDINGCTWQNPAAPTTVDAQVQHSVVRVPNMDGILVPDSPEVTAAKAALAAATASGVAADIAAAQAALRASRPYVLYGWSTRKYNPANPQQTAAADPPGDVYIPQYATYVSPEGTTSRVSIAGFRREASGSKILSSDEFVIHKNTTLYAFYGPKLYTAAEIDQMNIDKGYTE